MVGLYSWNGGSPENGESGDFAVDPPEEVPEYEEDMEEEGDEDEIFHEDIDFSDDELPVGQLEEVDQSVTIEEAIELVQKWVRQHSGTYRERSHRTGLDLISQEEHRDGVYELAFEFEGHYEGYGIPEEGEELVEDDRIREVVAYMYHDYLVGAVVDGFYDDRNLDEIDDLEAVKDTYLIGQDFESQVN